MREALAGRDRITPREAFVALGCPAERYEAGAAEVLCGLQASIGFKPYGDSWYAQPEETKALDPLGAELQPLDPAI